MEISERETQGLGGRITFTLNYFGTVSIFFYLHVLLIKKNNAEVCSDEPCTGISFSEKLALMS